MGKSASGKDSIFKALSDDTDFHFQQIVPYTTRPIRDGETHGVEYFFTDEDNFQYLKSSGKIIEDRAYNTIYGLWRYFTVADQQFECKDKNFIMITTLVSYKKLQECLTEYNFIPVYIDLDNGTRLQRALDREKLQENPKYTEMCRRFIEDEKDFSEDNIEAVEIHRRFINDDFNRCVQEIKNYIEEQL